MPSYYVQNSHPAIIAPEVFDLVQHEIQKRKATGYTSRIGCLSSKVVCGECGGYYGSKVWHSTSKYRRTIWQCNRKFKNSDKCRTPHLDESVIKQLFVDAFSSVLTNKTEIIDSYDVIIDRLTDCTALEKERSRIEKEQQNIVALMENLVARNASALMDQEEYNTRYDQHSKTYREYQTRKAEVFFEIAQLKIKRSRINVYIKTLSKREGLLTEFDEDLFAATVERITIHSAQSATLKFRDDSELTWEIPEKGRDA